MRAVREAAAKRGGMTLIKETIPEKLFGFISQP